MSTSAAESVEVPEAPAPGAFFGALEERRAAVMRLVEALPARGALATVVFDLLSQIAREGPAALQAGRVTALLARQRLDPDTCRLAADLDGGAERVPLVDVLVGTRRPPAAIEQVAALFAMGYAARLAPLDPVERRTFTLRVVGMLPGVERSGPFVLSDYVDHVCDEDDALRFWQIYVDRVAAEISRRAAGEPRSAAEPWLLSRLLDLHEQGPTPPPSAAWLVLTRHVNRVLQTHRHRWRFIRHLVEGCEDPRMLHYLCTAPTMAQDPEVLTVFLTRGNDKLISCALFTLFVYPDTDEVVEATLDHLRGRPFPEVAARLVDLYAQIHLPRQPGPALLRLAAGVGRHVAAHIDDGPVDALLQAVSNDARSLRQCLLLTDAVELSAGPRGPRHQQLLERVATTFFKAFTPSGSEHPLNDEVWRGAVRQAICRLVALEGPEIGDRLERFGMELAREARRWYPDEDDASRAARVRLTGRFVGMFADTLLGVCRSLYADEATRAAALDGYRILVQVFRAHASIAHGTGWFGAVEYVLPTFFPDLAAGPGDGDLEAPDDERTRAAAALVARVEHELWPPMAGPTVRLAVPPGGPARSTAEPASEARSPAVDPGGPSLRRRLDRDRPLTAPARLIGRSTGRLAALLRAYTGFDVAADLARRLLGLFGYRHAGRVTLTGRELVVVDEVRLLGRSVRRTTESYRLDELRGVRVRQQMRAFYLGFGLTALAVAGVLGGHLVFVGLRGGETRLALAGAAILAAGLAVDAAMFRLFDRNRGTLVLELTLGARPRRLRLLVDAERGAEVLDAFMTADAERRELEQLRHWEGADDAWEA